MNETFSVTNIIQFLILWMDLWLYINIFFRGQVY